MEDDTILTIKEQEDMCISIIKKCDEDGDYSCVYKMKKYAKWYANKVLEYYTENTIDLTGLLKDGYTFICPTHGLHPNCDCKDGQIKVFIEKNEDPSLELINKFVNWLIENNCYRDITKITLNNWYSKKLNFSNLTIYEVFEIFKKEENGR